MAPPSERVLQVDTSRFPIVVMTVSGRVTPADLQHMMDRYDALLAEGERYFNVVIQEAGADGFDAVQRKQIADWQRSREARVKEVNVGSAIVLTSALMRGALTALEWLAPPPTPQRSFSTREEAMEWARASLRQAGIEPPR
jgi:hypothetical protein